MITASHVQESSSGRRQLRRSPGLLAQFAVGGLLAGMSLFAQAADNTLQDIEIQSLPGDQVELRLIMSGPAPEPLAFTIDQPARISLDLAGTSLGMTNRRTDVGMGVLDTVLAVEANGRTRVVLNLDELVGYQTRAAGNIVYVTLDAAVSRQVTSTTAFASNTTSSAFVDRAIEDIDFRRTENGAGRVSITLSDPSIPVDVSQESGRVVLNFGNTKLPAELMRRFDVLDFATPVTTIDSLQVDQDTKLIIAARGKYEQLAYQSDRTFTVEILPVKETERNLSPTIFSGSKEYTGERLTLNFHDIEARAVLQLLADISGRNIVVSDTVSGNVTLRLQNVPWDQAMDIVLATKGLAMRENGNVIIVAPAAEITARERADLESKREIKELEPLYSEYLQVNYAKASDLAVLIGSGGGENSLTSERGSVAIDDRTNTLLLMDTAERIANIRRMVAKLDIPIRQVLIEARIVVVNDDFSRDIGMRWGFTGVDDYGDNGLIAVSGTGVGTDSIVQDGLANIAGGGSAFPVGVPALNDRYNVNVPIAGSAGTFALAILDDDYLVDLELSAIQAEGNGEVISSPRVITANQKEAKIEQGVEIPYQEASSSGATSVQFKSAVLSLTVTPQITPDDRIIMDLFVTKDSVGAIIDTGTGSVPSIDTRSVQTQVLVDNGQTVVLGGIYETETNEAQTKVPYLGDIPWVGALFRSTRVVSNKSELLIFVTPKILREGSTIF
jgi:type IV pilus assembly protein PilQ